MASNQANFETKIIKATQDSLGKIIKKPALTEKLLKRPPFKFLQDVISNVISSTGFMKDLFTEDELDSNSPKEKDAKIAFLQKAIDSVGSTLGKPVDVKAAKIVAGLEPEKTNQFLQQLARAATSGGTTDRKDSTTGGSTKTPALKTAPKTARPSINKQPQAPSTAKGKKELSSIERTKQSSEKSPTARKPPEKLVKGKPPTSGLVTSRKSASINSKETENSVKNSAQTLDGGEPTDQESGEKFSQQIEEENQANTKPEDDTDYNQTRTTNTTTTTTTTSNAGDEHESTQKVLPQLMVRPPTGSQTQYSPRASPRPSARPTTARAAPPKVVTKKDLGESPGAEDLEEARVLQSSEPVENLIAEKTRTTGKDGNNQEDGQTNDDDDEDDLFIVQESKEESSEPGLLLSRQIVTGGGGGSLDEGDIKKGSLVKQLVETKVQLEGDVNNLTDNSLERNGLSRLASRDIGKLRESIQRLTQLASPLGRILDYLQEDINSIIAELRGWQEEHARNNAALQEERSSIDAHLEPFRVQLEHLDQEIVRLVDSISTRKASIIRNEEKIERIIRMAIERVP